MIPTFLYSLAGGMLTVLGTARVEQIAAKFLRLIGLTAFGAVCGVTVWTLRQEPGQSAGGGWGLQLGMAAALLMIGVVLLAPFAERKPIIFRTLCVAAGILGLAAACSRTLAGLPVPSAPGSAPATLAIVGQVLGGLLLGSITVAWLLGHAYLTATKMTIAPLRHFSRMLSWAVIVRVVFVATSLVFAWTLAPKIDPLDPVAAPSVLTTLGNAWLIVSLRVATGLAGVGLFAYMVSDCVRLRSTQSATGILYFGSVFAYIGELASQYLLHECGWPL